MSIKFLQLNIEGIKHVDEVFKFIGENNFDVLCLQEVYEDTAKLIARKFNYFYVCAEGKHGGGNSPAVFSKTPIKSFKEDFLTGTDERYREGKPYVFSLLSCVIESGEIVYNILNTHLPVNYPGSEISEYQKECYKKLKEILATKEDFLFSADTNAPRGTFIFDDLAKNYKDNIPQNISSTLDPILHRAGHLEYVVDCVFSTKNYEVTNVQIHEGLSDHKGITGTLTIKEN